MMQSIFLVMTAILILVGAVIDIRSHYHPVKLISILGALILIFGICAGFRVTLFDDEVQHNAGTGFGTGRKIQLIFISSGLLTFGIGYSVSRIIELKNREAEQAAPRNR